MTNSRVCQIFGNCQTIVRDVNQTNLSKFRNITKQLIYTTKQLESFSESLDPARKVVLGDINQELVDNIHELSALLKELYNDGKSV